MPFAGRVMRVALGRLAKHACAGLCVCVAVAIPSSAWAQAAGGVDQEPTQRSGGLRGVLAMSISIPDLLRGVKSIAREWGGQDAVYEPGQLLVMWPSSAAATPGLVELAQRYQLQPVERVSLPLIGGEIAVFQFATQDEAERQRLQLRRDYPSWTIDLNARAELLQMPVPTDATASAVSAADARLYALRMLGLRPHRSAASARSVRIGVIDSGIDARLLVPDREPSAWNGSLFFEHSTLAVSDVPAATTHGTAVAQLLAGRDLLTVDFAGSAPAGSFWWAAALRQTGRRQSTHTVLLSKAFEWLLARHVQLINLSAGGAGDDILKSVVEKVVARDVTLVAAAGNRPDATPVYPAAYAGVWAVGAVDAAGRRYTQGSLGDFVGFAAPGVEVWVPDAEGWRAANELDAVSGRYLSGTSFAAALATGGLAGAPSSFWDQPNASRFTHACRSAKRALSDQGCGLLQALDHSRNSLEKD